MVIGLCKMFSCLPEAGGLMDQSADLFRMIQIYELGTQREEVQ